jgi:pilus assembly protein Flp/PilA
MRAGLTVNAAGTKNSDGVKHVCKPGRGALPVQARDGPFLPPDRAAHRNTATKVRLMFTSLVSTARALKSDKRGISALEYGLLAGLIAVVLIGVLTTFATDVKNLFNGVSGDVSSISTAT